MSYVKLGSTTYLGFATANPSTGTRQDADVLPVVTVYANGVLLGYAPVVSNLATGRYHVKLDWTTGNGFAANQDIHVDCAATVAGISGTDTIGQFIVQANSQDDVGIAALLAEKLLRNKFITDPVTGMATLYDDDNVTILMQGQLYQDAAGTITYHGQGSERRERLA